MATFGSDCCKALIDSSLFVSNFRNSALLQYALFLIFLEKKSIDRFEVSWGTFENVQTSKPALSVYFYRANIATFPIDYKSLHKNYLHNLP